MKRFILILFVAFFAPITFAQEEQAAISHVESSLSFEGTFSFTIDQTEYYIRFKPHDNLYEELDDQGVVIGYGAYDHADISTVSPELIAANGAITNVLRFSIVDRSATTISVNVSNPAGNSNVIELHKL